ncbi:hypothetical protein FJY63_11635 [Candidatus Sumerlaeota bacterium]|nr:hypothetical protein [Candidatus Sumerlaeota bacterium]
MNADENILRAVRFDTPERIPMHFHINAACWRHYRQNALQELMASHPLLFPDFTPSAQPVVPDYVPEARAGRPYKDSWGCVWETTDDGIVGTVTGHPLADWQSLERFVMPDIEQTDGRHAIDWKQFAERMSAARRGGRIALAELPHGHTFLLLSDLRGYENLILDMAEDDRRLTRLIEIVETFNLSLVQRFIELGATWIGYPDDLGMQQGPMLSPWQFQRYIKPIYQHLMAPARQAGCVVHMHSDGDIRELVDDLVACGVDVLNLQDLVNGIDWIRSRLAGRVCVELDIDRQRITRFGTPAQIDALIREEVETLGSRSGGLMMIFGLYPGTPLENVAALMDAMERYATYYA